MTEVTNPFTSEPWQLSLQYRPRFTQYNPTTGEAEKPLGFVDYLPGEHNFDQTNGDGITGGNWYFNLSGNWVFEGSGSLRLDAYQNSLVWHPDEYWTDEIDFDNERDTFMKYGIVEASLYLTDRWEDHIPQKGVKFKFEFKKRTIVTEQNYELVAPPPNTYPAYWTSTPGAVNQISEEEEMATFEVPMPDDIDVQKHYFRSIELSEQDRIDKGFIFPGKGGTFHDGTEKFGYDHEKDEREFRRFYFDDPPVPGMYYRVLTKITTTTIRYEVDPGLDVVDVSCTPAAFYNRE